MSTRVSPSRPRSPCRGRPSEAPGHPQGMATDFGVAVCLAGVPDVLEHLERRSQEDAVSRIAALPNPDDEIAALGRDEDLILPVGDPDELASPAASRALANGPSARTAAPPSASISSCISSCARVRDEMERGQGQHQWDRRHMFVRRRRPPTPWRRRRPLRRRRTAAPRSAPRRTESEQTEHDCLAGPDPDSDPPSSPPTETRTSSWSASAPMAAPRSNSSPSSPKSASPKATGNRMSSAPSSPSPSIRTRLPSIRARRLPPSSSSIVTQVPGFSERTPEGAGVLRVHVHVGPVFPLLLHLVEDLLAERVAEPPPRRAAGSPRPWCRRRRLRPGREARRFLSERREGRQGEGDGCEGCSAQQSHHVDPNERSGAAVPGNRSAGLLPASPQLLRKAVVRGWPTARLAPPAGNAGFSRHSGPPGRGRFVPTR